MSRARMAGRDTCVSERKGGLEAEAKMAGQQNARSQHEWHDPPLSNTTDNHIRERSPRFRGHHRETGKDEAMKGRGQDNPCAKY